MSVSASVLQGMMVLVSACALGGAAPTSPESKDVRFVVMGDMPYSNYERQVLQTDVKQAIAQADVPFLIHYGDFKAGNDSCTDELFQQVYTDIKSLHAKIFYTPGDNDWTDCDRSGLIEPKSELERLEFLRALFFSGETNEAVQRQKHYPENARWWHEGALFATFHMVGTKNGRTQILKDDVSEAIAQVDARDQANRTWLIETFAEARIKGAHGLVMTMQADLSESQDRLPDCTDHHAGDCDAYGNFRQLLRKEAASFKQVNQTLKPVLVIHGDTFPFCLEPTFGGQTAPNLWRLNAWGDFQQPADVTAIAFRPRQPQNPFHVETLVNRVSPALCSATAEDQT